MERLPGHTLADQIAAGPLAQFDVYVALRSVLAALSAAHSAGMLHRDIKPGNILLTPSAGVKVADFGIVKTPDSVHTTTGQIVGTLAYLSPDRIGGEPAAVSDDLYAVGVVGYEALAGRKPFLQEDIAPLARAISEDEPIPLQHMRPDVDPLLAEVIGRAMSKDPLQRFGSADDMRAALGGAASPVIAGPHPPFHAQLRPPTRVLTAQYAQPSAAYVMPAAEVGRRSTRKRKVAGAAAVFAALTVAVLAFALDPSTTTLPSTPAPASVSTPTSVAAVPPPAVEPLPDPPSPVVEQADSGPNGNGRGSAGGHGNGHGKKPK
jgi:serine/threonine-protein kinase